MCDIWQIYIYDKQADHNKYSTEFNTHSTRDVYCAEGPMLKASVTPCTLVDIVRCSKLQTTVDAFAVQSPSKKMKQRCHRFKNTWEEDDVDRQRAVTLDASQKPNRPAHSSSCRQRGHGSGGLLFQYFVRAKDQNG